MKHDFLYALFILATATTAAPAYAARETHSYDKSEMLTCVNGSYCTGNFTVNHNVPVFSGEPASLKRVDISYSLLIEGGWTWSWTDTHGRGVVENYYKINSFNNRLDVIDQFSEDAYLFDDISASYRSDITPGTLPQSFDFSHLSAAYQKLSDAKSLKLFSIDEDDLPYRDQYPLVALTGFTDYFIGGEYLCAVCGNVDRDGWMSVSYRFEISYLSVPEPTVWAMLLVAFGIVGMRLRSSRFLSSRHNEQCHPCAS